MRRNSAYPVRGGNESGERRNGNLRLVEHATWRCYGASGCLPRAAAPVFRAMFFPHCGMATKENGLNATEVQHDCTESETLIGPMRSMD